ncbi:phage major capsid protein [Sphingomonas sp. HITSZ_GF]|uniref:phage major capsid protein n=1 Tax=Sphingomonas sp. HITSZ_GF TaxID=3037247 RepID=UPI00240E0FD7|nr:phage major capsid protein [Sphingomonas sp. HITSZ_GF]MDG2532066.1 phage major capsid protein [Sphingomonas sp. HITSZ_GF]
MSANDLTTELNKLTEEFKSAIGRADEAATERLNNAIAEVEGKMRSLQAEANRPTGDANDDAEVKSYREYLRTRDIKSMSVGSATDGGVTVPKIIHSQIQAYLRDNSAMRQIASVVSTSTPDYNFPVQTTGSTAEWTGETATRNTTGTPTIVNVKPPVGELVARALITQTLIEDSAYDLQSFLVNDLGESFNAATGTAFVTGDGTNQPKGLLSYPTAAVTDKAGTRPYGTFQHIASGTSAALGDAEKLMDLTMAVKPGYRAKGKFVMTRATLNFYRKLKDNNGQFIWQPSLQAGVPSTLLGYPVYEDENMGEAGTAGALAVAFGDFEAGYVIVDRVSMSTMVDPYSFDPFIAIKARARVGGAAKDTSAIKFLKLAAS